MARGFSITTLPEIIGAFVTDALGLATIPGRAVAGVLVSQFFRRRAKTLRDLLFEELRRANMSGAQVADRRTVTLRSWCAA